MDMDMDMDMDIYMDIRVILRKSKKSNFSKIKEAQYVALEFG